MSIANSPDLHSAQEGTDFLDIASDEITSQEVAEVPRDLGSGGSIVARHREPVRPEYRVQARFRLTSIHTAESVRELLSKLRNRGVSVTDPNPEVVEQGEADLYRINGEEILALDGSYYHLQIAIHELTQAGIRTTLSYETHND